MAPQFDSRFRPTTIIEDSPQIASAVHSPLHPPLPPLSHAPFPTYSSQDHNSITSAPSYRPEYTDKLSRRASAFVLSQPFYPPPPPSSTLNPHLRQHSVQGPMEGPRFPPAEGHRRQYQPHPPQFRINTQFPPASSRRDPASPSVQHHPNPQATLPVHIPSQTNDIPLYFTLNPHASFYGSPTSATITSPEERGRRLTLQIPPSVWPIDESLEQGQQLDSTLDSKSVSFCSSSHTIVSARPDALSMIARMNRRHHSESPAPSLGSGTSSEDAASHGSCPSTPQIGAAEPIDGDEYGIPQLNSAAQNVLSRFNFGIDQPAPSDGSYTSESDYIYDSDECSLQEIASNRPGVDSHARSSRSSSVASFDRHRVPSPDRFFESLHQDARAAWTNPSRDSQYSMEVPNTGQALHFYGAPWRSDDVVEQTVSTTIEADSNITPGPPTARRIPAEELAQYQPAFSMTQHLSSPPPSARRIPDEESSSQPHPSLGPPIQLFDRSGALMADGANWLYSPDKTEHDRQERASSPDSIDDSFGLNEYYGFVPSKSASQPAKSTADTLRIDTSASTSTSAQPEYDPHYTFNLNQKKARNWDRTTSWLMNQDADPYEGDASPVVGPAVRIRAVPQQRSKLSLDTTADVFAPLDEAAMTMDEEDMINSSQTDAPKFSIVTSGPKIVPALASSHATFSPVGGRAPALPTIPEAAEPQLSPVAPVPAAPAAVKDPLFFQGFKHLRETSGLAPPPPSTTVSKPAGSSLPAPASALVYGKMRDEAMRLTRTCLQTRHRDILNGIFALHISDADKKRFCPVQKKDESDEEHRRRMIVAQVEKERQVVEQLSPVVWVLDAIKTLNGGNLLLSPARQDLVACFQRWSEESAAQGSADENGDASLSNLENVRTILDLGGRATADWAWEVSLQYPNARVFTVSVDPAQRSCGASGDPEQLCGPLNHIEIKAPNLWTLPFPSNTIDVISARSLYTILKSATSATRSLRPGDCASPASSFGPDALKDEYQRTLAEIYRVLKPGGYLEFSLLDADILGGGSRAQDLSVMFCNKLKDSDYDPVPTKNFISRLRAVGFDQVHRTWMILPMCGVGSASDEDTAEERMSKYRQSKEEFNQPSEKAAGESLDLDSSLPTRSVVQKIRSLGILKDHARTSSGKWNNRTSSMGATTIASGHQTSGSIWSLLSNKAQPAVPAVPTANTNGVSAAAGVTARSPPNVRIPSTDSFGTMSPHSEPDRNRNKFASPVISSPESVRPAVPRVRFPERTDSSDSNQSSKSSLTSGSNPASLGPAAASSSTTNSSSSGDAPSASSTTASASYVTGMVGSWAWEQWMVRLHKKLGMGYASDAALLKQIAEALDEGARTGAAWRYLTGWARKDVGN